MVPSNAAWGYGSRVRFPFPRLNLTTEEKVLFLAATTLVAGPWAIMRGTGMGVSAARVLLLSLLWQDPPSPGGGGPGPSPISTTPPLSLEATGASLAQVGKPGGPASSAKRRSRPRRKKCPKGYHWSKYLRMCIRDEPEIRLSTRRKY